MSQRADNLQDKQKKLKETGHVNLRQDSADNDVNMERVLGDKGKDQDIPDNTANTMDGNRNSRQKFNSRLKYGRSSYDGNNRHM